MVTSGMMVIMHRSGGIAKRLDTDSERKVRDIAKGATGSEVAFERAGGAFTFEIDVKSEEEMWQTPRRVAKKSTQQMDCDEAVIVPSYFDNLWDEQEYDELQCAPCESFFHRP